MAGTLFTFVLIVVCFGALTAQRPGGFFGGPYKPKNAVCVLSSGDLEGVIRFSQAGPDQYVQVTGTLNGLSPGKHGFHIHEYGDLSNGCLSTGPHFNPRNQPHGDLNQLESHVGDMGNIEADGSGTAHISLKSYMLQLCGPFSIMGRGLVVHGGQDDLGLGGNEESKKTGNSGPRVGCCIIGAASNTS